MFEQAFTGKAKVFGTNPMFVLPYHEKFVDDEIRRKFDGCRLVSLAKENIIIRRQTFKERKVRFDAIGAVPSPDWIQKLAYILNCKIAPVGVESQRGPCLDILVILT